MSGKRIITISREFGSGGRSIGKALAERLGISYYDKELVKQIALESGFDPKFVEEKADYASEKHGLSYLFNYGTPGVMRGLSAAEYLWSIQCEVIAQLAEKEPCVIVGRCADYILRDRDDVLNAFIYADEAFREERIVRLYGQSEQTPEKRLADKDGKRRVNYKHFTGGEWGLARNYDISLSTSAFGIETCTDILEALYRGKAEE